MYQWFRRGRWQDVGGRVPLILSYLRMGIQGSMGDHLLLWREKEPIAPTARKIHHGEAYFVSYQQFCKGLCRDDPGQGPLILYHLRLGLMGRVGEHVLLSAQKSTTVRRKHRGPRHKFGTGGYCSELIGHRCSVVTWGYLWD